MEALLAFGAALLALRLAGRLVALRRVDGMQPHANHPRLQPDVGGVAIHHADHHALEHRMCVGLARGDQCECQQQCRQQAKKHDAMVSGLRSDSQRFRVEFVESCRGRIGTVAGCRGPRQFLRCSSPAS